jgi:hypothetical protein
MNLFKELAIPFRMDTPGHCLPRVIANQADPLAPLRTMTTGVSIRPMMRIAGDPGLISDLPNGFANAGNDRSTSRYRWLNPVPNLTRAVSIKLNSGL